MNNTIIRPLRILAFSMIFLLLTGPAVFSQKLVSEIEDQDWNIMASRSFTRHAHVNNSVSFKASLEGFRSSIIMLSENEAAAIVSIGGKEHGVMKFDDKMRIIWQTTLPGEPYLLFRFYDDLLAFVDIGKRYAREYQLFFINPATGNIRKQAKYYDLEKFNITSPETNFYPLYNKTSGEYKLCIRHFDKKEKELTLSMNMITFDKDYNIIANDLVPVLNSGYFVDCGLNSNGDFVLLSMSETGMLTAQAFGAKTWIPKTKISLDLPIKDKSRYRAGLRFSSHTAENVFVFAEYTNKDKEALSTVFKLNFTRGTYASREMGLDKKAVKEISGNYRPEKGMKRPDFGSWDNMRFADIIDHGDRIVIFREVLSAYGSQTRTYTTTGDAFLSIMDKDMKPVADAVIPKKFVTTSAEGISSALHVHNNNLLVISGNGDRDGLLANIDIQTGRINKIETLEKQSIRSKYPCEPRATLWFKNGFAVPYIDPDVKISGVYRLQTNLQLYNY